MVHADPKELKKITHFKIQALFDFFVLSGVLCKQPHFSLGMRKTCPSFLKTAYSGVKLKQTNRFKLINPGGPRYISSNYHYSRTYTSTISPLLKKNLEQNIGYRGSKSISYSSLLRKTDPDADSNEINDGVAKSLDDTMLERSLSTKPVATLERLRCTVFDSTGNVTVVSGEFNRSELLSKHGLLPRDLRKIDKVGNEIVPTILVRTNSILISLLHIRALIKADMVILFNLLGSTDSHTQSVFMYDLEGKLKQSSQEHSNSLPYEFCALEAVFISVIQSLDAEIRVHTTVINGILAELEDHIDREKLRFLLIQSKKLTTFFQKTTLIRDILDDLLEQDDDLAEMYLTEKSKGIPRDTHDHAEVEMLLETYYKHCDEIVQTVGNLISNIRSTEEIVNIILDSNRNRLMLLGLRFSIGTLALGVGTFIASLYGMNLKNFIEESDFAFFGVSAVCGIITIAVLLHSLKILRGMQKVTMMDKSSKGKRKKRMNI